MSKALLTKTSRQRLKSLENNQESLRLMWKGTSFKKKLEVAEDLRATADLFARSRKAS